jgi:hypothetical protein
MQTIVAIPEAVGPRQMPPPMPPRCPLVRLPGSGSRVSRSAWRSLLEAEWASNSS